MEEKRYDAVIFDVDGTLIHTSNEYIDLVFGLTFDELKIRGDLELKKRLWYSPNRDEVVKEIYPSVDEFWSVFDLKQTQNKEIRKRNSDVYCLDDLIVLDLLKNVYGAKLGIVTNSTKEMLGVLTEKLDKDRFNYVTYVYKKYKSKADGILDCMEQIGAKKRNTLYIGNDDIDIASADKVRIDCGVISRPGWIEYEWCVPSLKAKYNFKELSDLLELFPKI